MKIFANSSFIILLFACSLAEITCSGRFVKREILEDLNTKYAKDKVYLLKKDVNIGNGEIMHKGSRVRIWISSDSFSVKVKAYGATDSREKAVGKNIVFMYENQFTNEDFEMPPFEKELKDTIEPAPEITEKPAAGK